MDLNKIKGSGAKGLNYINSVSNIEPIFKKYEIKPNKALGQNFLRDNELSKNIVDSLSLHNDDILIEVGPGLGALTQFLVNKVKRLILIEFDYNISELLSLIFYGCDDVEIINEDAVNFDLRNFYLDGGVKVIGNLPYSSGSEIIRSFLSFPTPVTSCVFMLQKEVAERYCAIPRTKAYGVNTVLVGSRWKIKNIVECDSSPFIPRPSVNSTVLKFELLNSNDYEPHNYNVLRKVLFSGFRERRKQIKKRLNIETLSWDDTCEMLDINITARSEELSIDQWIRMARLHDKNPLKDIPQSSEEIYDVVDNNDSIIGQADRDCVHNDKLFHRAIHVFVLNRHDEILLQKRSMQKDTFPGLWGSSASGHLDTGEDYEGAAVRELNEELGIESKLNKISKIEPTASTGWEFIGLFTCEHNGPFNWPYSEVETLGFFKIKMVSKWIKKRPEDFSSGFIECFNSYKF
ncbi:16S rRNA (adenine(1518)-N(6)/adenine(1519)-N(6))-dimethyltransferase RsmA [Verrucomicrobiales bacterium]|nr:16S rRNA (adenine(1518)-N(6)/adenine(1519)-N(6))-dimethyltransferase RsmA [Verrucomicrobiales bacterium]